jgi:hypothetical protein
MEVDEGSKDMKHANVESVDDEEFFEFEEVESFYNNKTEEEHSATPGTTNNDTPQCRFCWSSCTEHDNPLISSC